MDAIIIENKNNDKANPITPSSEMHLDGPNSQIVRALLEEEVLTEKDVEYSQTKNERIYQNKAYVIPA